MRTWHNNNIQLLYILLLQKVQSTTDKKKVKKIFQTKKLKTCLKLMINELTHFLARSDNVYFANSEQSSS